MELRVSTRYRYKITYLLLVVAFSGDKGAYTLSADQTWVITWKIIGDRSWSNDRGGDRSWSGKFGLISIVHLLGLSRYDFLDYVFLYIV